MKLRRVSLFLALVFAAASLTAQTEHHGVSKTGTVGAPHLVGPSLTVSDQATSATNHVDVYCPITAYGSDAVGTFWRCGDGYLLVNGVRKAEVLSGKMSMSCWFAEAGDTVSDCMYSFAGRTAEGPLQFSARGDQYIGTIFYFDGVW